MPPLSGPLANTADHRPEVFRVECDGCGRFEIDQQLLEDFRLAYEMTDTGFVELFPKLAESVRRAGGVPHLSSDRWRELVRT